MTTRDLCLAGIKRPEGIGASELPVPRTTACMNFKKLVRDGLAFKAGTHMEMRYFDNKERAQAFTDRMRVDRAPAKRAYVPMGSKRKPTRSGWGPDDPPVITSKTKVTIAPTPPRALYSNTYPRF